MCVRKEAVDECNILDGSRSTSLRGRAGTITGSTQVAAASSTLKPQFQTTKRGLKPKKPRHNWPTHQNNPSQAPHVDPRGRVGAPDFEGAVVRDVHAGSQDASEEGLNF